MFVVCGTSSSTRSLPDWATSGLALLVANRLRRLRTPAPSLFV
jgi:hypothetical protein